ncbi:hypothetical protein AZI86_11730 [Bdellovibrio bacteriovorus]|uniref:Major facilitator superfamily (MFS) profile domain-containing protein n=1 Tax=Bdellovibrio bacteriovorus TaxID=959 RepID=A0A150WLT2_BDEBC|nr:MFS transporter [Bdellovibrio bacteriovorus]KYG64866.1 hypothetical protein AZI86_11730 [Bdellovibrio bacteriovorus]
MNLICFGSFYLSSVFVTELSPAVTTSGGEPTLLMDFLAFFVGFLARPVGALWFGVRGDLISPRKAIKESILLLIFSTALMGVLPSAPATNDLYFILLRCFQGIGLGGAYAAMAVYLYESAPADKRNRFTSWIQFSVAIGYITALLGVVMLKTIYAQEFYIKGGWRIAFFLPIAGLFFLEPFREDENQGTLVIEKAQWLRSCILTIRRQGKSWTPYLAVLIATGILSFTASNFKFYFMKVILKMDPVAVDFASGIGTILFLPFYYIGGVLADRFGSFKICWISVAVGCLWMFPSFKILEGASYQSSHQTLTIAFAVASLGAILVTGFAAMIAMLCDLFPRNMRCTLFALSYSLTVGFLGSLVHGYGIHAFQAHGFRYAGIFLAVGIATVCVLGSAYLYFPSDSEKNHS